MARLTTARPRAVGETGLLVWRRDPWVRALWRWVLVGLLVRLAVMPFTMHTDWRWVGDLAAMNVYARGLLTGEVGYPTVGYPALTYLTLAAFQLLLWPLLPALPVTSTAEPGALMRWLEAPEVFRTLFLLKLPYLAFDLAIAGLLAVLARSSAGADEHLGKTRALRAVTFWQLWPLVILGPYVHGQFDLLPTFWVVVALVCWARGQSRRSFLALGLGACYKNYPFFFIPLWLILVPRWRERAFGLVFALAPYVLLSIPSLFQNGDTVPGTVDYYARHLLTARQEVGSGQVVYLFVLAYLVILWWVAQQRLLLRAATTNVLTVGVVLVLLAYYSFAVAALHYYVWAMPFVALLVARDRRLVWPVALLTVAAVGVSFSIGRPLAAGLLAPLHPLLFLGLPSPLELLGPIVEPTKFVNLARSVLVGAATWVTIGALRQMRDERVARAG